MNPPTQRSKPLSDPELDRLAAFLAGVKNDSAMSLEELDGFFCALIAGPSMVMPSEYLPLIWGGELPDESAFASLEDANATLQFIMRHWNSIVDEIERDKIYLPLILDDEQTPVPGREWARGFMRGARLRWEDWRELFTRDDEGQLLTIPLVAGAVAAPTTILRMPKSFRPMRKKPSLNASQKIRPQPPQRQCDTCQQAIAVADGVSYGSIETGYRELCGRCFNDEVAREGGIDFQHVHFQPIPMRDANGNEYEFHFRLRLLGNRVAINSFEIDEAGEPGGYEFQILGEDPEGDLFVLMGQIVERMRRVLAQCHLTEEDGQLHVADFLVRGRIAWDREKDGRVPIVVVDGREISWEQFGRMLMTFEGWQFKLEIRDKSEEV